MRGHVESLNVSVAAGIALFEAVAAEKSQGGDNTSTMDGCEHGTGSSVSHA